MLKIESDCIIAKYCLDGENNELNRRFFCGPINRDIYSLYYMYMYNDNCGNRDVFLFRSWTDSGLNNRTNVCLYSIIPPCLCCCHQTKYIIGNKKFTTIDGEIWR